MMVNSEYSSSPFLWDKLPSLTMATLIRRVLSVLWNEPPLAKCSSDTFKSVSPYTLWSSTKAMCKAVQLPNGYPSRGCNGDSRATIFSGSFSTGTTLTVDRRYKSRNRFSRIAAGLLSKTVA